MSIKREAAKDPRRRLPVDDRRQELLLIGMRLFSTRAYDEISVEQIADEAGISRGLLYHYFPTKRDFYVAVTRAAAAQAGELTAPDPALPPQEQLRAAIEAFLRYAEEHAQGFLTAYRGGLSADPEVRAIIEQGRQRQASRIFGVIASTREPPSLLRLAVFGWIALAQDVTARWLASQEPAREQVGEMLVRALSGAVTAAANADHSVAGALRSGIGEAIDAR
jgi:AcrR family transcriptional regulator